MHVSVQAVYDADVDLVGQMLADEDFVTQKVRSTGATWQQVDVVGGAAESFTVTTRRQLPTTDIPAQFRSLVGSNLEVRQVEAWEAPETGVRRGTVVIEIAGVPVRLSGRMRLEPAAEGGTLHRVDGELKASIPLFGAAVEQATAGAVREAFAAEARAGAAWLGR
ncbi:DUF2505 domain-containing protein [Cellulomonas bogoriensis]|uniref:Proteinase inhibitor I25 cystatin n=1 Tax=Cellulomonas bogoriensis 69B4 = DSM 16987 TaxID=1386082 RepID=A0A0A0BV18_9CELL|nr:DUF2505 domain-containing protein [Cellulomonas bogoriensis]KGM11019.1 hypothetical protein N869_03010 [Cellulomonas bogoriensis 69B4 = DSM 16987]